MAKYPLGQLNPLTKKEAMNYETPLFFSHILLVDQYVIPKGSF